jgi:flavodoxin
MKAVAVVFSQSGHTAHFARAIAEQFRKKGVEADIELLRTEKFINPGSKNIKFKRMPELDGYDIVCIGGPVWAFKSNPAVIAYLNELDSLKGKKAAAFVTHSLPWKSFGAAKKAMTRLTCKIDALGAKTVDAESLQWNGMPKAEVLEKAATNLVSRFI